MIYICISICIALLLFVLISINLGNEIWDYVLNSFLMIFTCVFLAMLRYVIITHTEEQLLQPGFVILYAVSIAFTFLSMISSTILFSLHPVVPFIVQSPLQFICFLGFLSFMILIGSCICYILYRLYQPMRGDLYAEIV